MAISPFSLENDWVVHWERLPSNFQAGPILGQVSINEQQALKAVASVGLITASQLFNLFSLNSDRVKKMVKRNRLVKHELVMNKEYRITMFSLGVNGAKIAGVMGYYKINYWVEYRIPDILKRLLFLNFYERFYPNELLPAIDPFVGAIKINDKLMYVYVVRGDLNDIMMYLKWNPFKERLILITESLLYLEQLKPFLHDMKVRVILDESILDKGSQLNNSFYMFEENEFQLEKMG